MGELRELREPRKAFGEVLLELEREGNIIIVVTADLAKSTNADQVKNLFNLGVAEEDAISTAAGMAADGQPVFLTTFAVFGAYLGFGQIIQSVCLNNLPVKLVFTHDGLNVGADGASHQAILALAIMRTLPGLKIAVPADYYETKAVIRKSFETPGPVCVLLPREAGEVIYDENVDFQFGKSRIHPFGEEPKILLIACGLLVAEAFKAAQALLERGLSSTVLNASSIKPLDSARILEISRGVERIFTIEEHSIIGGLGGAVCELLGGEKNHPPITIMGIPDEFGQSGKQIELWDYFGLTPEKIAEIVLKKMEE